jgi:hypothetical protein
MKVCICGVKKYPQLVWMAFVESDGECEEEEKAIREHFDSEVACEAMDVPRRIVFMPTEDSVVNTL